MQKKQNLFLKKFYENDNRLDENYIGKLGRTKEFLDIKTLIENLDRVRNIPVFIRKIQNDQQQILKNYEQYKKKTYPRIAIS